MIKFAKRTLIAGSVAALLSSGAMANDFTYDFNSGVVYMASNTTGAFLKKEADAASSKNKNKAYFKSFNVVNPETASSEFNKRMLSGFDVNSTSLLVDGNFYSYPDPQLHVFAKPVLPEESSALVNFAGWHMTLAYRAFISGKNYTTGPNPYVYTNFKIIWDGIGETMGFTNKTVNSSPMDKGLADENTALKIELNATKAALQKEIKDGDAQNAQNITVNAKGISELGVEITKLSDSVDKRFEEVKTSITNLRTAVQGELGKGSPIDYAELRIKLVSKQVGKPEIVLEVNDKQTLDSSQFGITYRESTLTAKKDSSAAKKDLAARYTNTAAGEFYVFVPDTEMGFNLVIGTKATYEKSLNPEGKNHNGFRLNSISGKGGMLLTQPSVKALEQELYRIGRGDLVPALYTAAENFYDKISK